MEERINQLYEAYSDAVRRDNNLPLAKKYWQELTALLRQEPKND